MMKALVFVLVLCACTFPSEGAIRMGTHGIRLHHEWEKSASVDEWQDWEASFDNSDVNRDGRIRLTEVVNVFRDHFNHIYHNNMDSKTKSRHSVAESSHFEEEARDFIKFVQQQRRIAEAKKDEGSPGAAERRRRRASEEHLKPPQMSKTRKEFIHRRARQLVEAHEDADMAGLKPNIHDQQKELEQTISFSEFKRAMHK